MRLSALIALPLALCATTLAAQPAAWPNTFRDVPFGASVSDAEKVLGPMGCSANVPFVPDAKICTTTDRDKAFRVDGEVVKTYYTFHRDRFLRVQFSQSEPMMYRGAATKNLSGPIVFAFTEKYGKVTSTGGSATGIRFAWDSDIMSASVDVGIKEFRSQFGGGTDKAQFLRLAEIKLKEWDEIVSAAEKSKVDF